MSGFVGGDLPAGWATATLGELCEIQTGLALGKRRRPGISLRSVPYLRVANVQRGRLDLSEIKTVDVSEDELEKLVLHFGDILMNEGGDRDKLGRGWIWSGEILECIHQNHVHRLRPREATLSSSFISHYTNAFGRRYFVEEGKQTTNLASISQEKVSEFLVAVPPATEQRRIVAKIDSLSARSRRAREELTRVERLVEKAKQAVLTTAYLGQLTASWREGRDLESADDLVARTREPEQSRGGRQATVDVRPGVAGMSVNIPSREAPSKWAWISLRRLARQETGHTPTRDRPAYWNGGIPWIGIRDAGLHHGRVIWETKQTISSAGLDNSSARLLPAGTVCLSRTASVGYVTIMGTPMATSQDFATWTCGPALDPKFLMFALMAEGENIRSFGEGSTHTTIYFPEIRALHICLAPLAEQHEIVRRIEAAFARLDRLAAEAAKARGLLDRLDQAVLAKAFRGELVPQDPDDEPASVLLERIRAERAKAPPARGRRGRPRKAAG